MTAICFDLDGTLTNPMLGITSCIRHALVQLGREAPEPEELTWCIGPPLLQSFETLLGDGEEAKAALAAYRERFGAVGLYENEVYPGIPDLLAELSRGGRRLFVATSKPAVYAEKIVEHFGLARHFETVFGSELDGTRADKTDLLAWVVEQAQLEAETTVMIGDRRHDMIGARNNNMIPLGVLYGFGSRTELEDAGARYFCAAPFEVGEVLG